MDVALELGGGSIRMRSILLLVEKSRESYAKDPSLFALPHAIDD